MKFLLSLLIMLFSSALAASPVKPTGPVAPAQAIGRFQVIPSDTLGAKLLLLDTATGDTWLPGRCSKDSIINCWFPMRVEGFSPDMEKDPSYYIPPVEWQFLRKNTKAGR